MRLSSRISPFSDKEIDKAIEAVVGLKPEYMPSKRVLRNIGTMLSRRFKPRGNLQATIQEAVLECTKAKPLPEEKKRLYVAVANKVIERRGQPSGKSCFDRNTVRPHAGKEHSATF